MMKAEAPRGSFGQRVHHRFTGRRIGALSTGGLIGAIKRLQPILVVVVGFVGLLRSAIATPRSFCLSGSGRTGVIDPRGAVDGLNVRIIVIHDVDLTALLKRTPRLPRNSDWSFRTAPFSPRSL